jgi:hypothetical protein
VGTMGRKLLILARELDLQMNLKKLLFRILIQNIYVKEVLILDKAERV